MARVSIVNALVMAAAVVMTTAVAVSAQEAPAPSPDKGAGFSVAVSGVMVIASLFSSFALLRH